MVLRDCDIADRSKASSSLIPPLIPTSSLIIRISHFMNDQREALLEDMISLLAEAEELKKSADQAANDGRDHDEQNYADKLDAVMGYYEATKRAYQRIQDQSVRAMLAVLGVDEAAIDNVSMMAALMGKPMEDVAGLLMNTAIAQVMQRASEIRSHSVSLVWKNTNNGALASTSTMTKEDFRQALEELGQ